MTEYSSFNYNGSSDISVSELVKSYTQNVTDYDFLIYDGKTGMTNKDRIWLKYSLKEKSENQAKYDSDSLTFVKPSTQLVFPKKDLLIEEVPLFNSNQVLIKKDFNGYFSDFLALLSNSGYQKSSTVIDNVGNYTLQEISENCLVYVWVRALDKILNLTPLIRDVTIQSGESGGFTFTIDPILDLSDIIFLGNDILNLTPIFNKKGLILDELEISLQTNDVVFIRLERLEMESDVLLNNSLEIPIGQLNSPEKVWDMIGLIDTASVIYSAQSNDKMINVSGRDLNKLLVEDGAYFLPYQYIEGKDTDQKLVWGGDQSSSWFKRNVISGAYDYFFAHDIKTIKDSLAFIINHLSNIGICDNKLFDSYTEKSTLIPITNIDKGYVSSKEVNGVWQIIRLQIDPELEDRVFAGNSLMNPDGSLIDFFNQVCQSPFVEFWGDTYGAYFNLIVRQAPYSFSAIRNVWNNRQFIEIEEADLLGMNLNFDTRSFSSFEIEPENSFFGHEDGLFKSIVPAIVLPEFSYVYGNKRLVIKDSYLHRKSMIGVKSELDSSKFIEGLLNDYRYVIESNSYLPFTRQGSITINGDRRIKKGTFVLNKATNELFHVIGVSHNISISDKIERVTNIQVERGMITDFINEKMVLSFNEANLDDPNIKAGFYSYFNIVNADLIIQNIRLNIQGKQTEKRVKIESNFSVNENSFNFFVKRKQFRS